jgi:hypothetical protein
VATDGQPTGGEDCGYKRVVAGRRVLWLHSRTDVRSSLRPHVSSTWAGSHRGYARLPDVLRSLWLRSGSRRALEHWATCGYQTGGKDCGCGRGAHMRGIPVGMGRYQMVGLHARW